MVYKNINIYTVEDLKMAQIINYENNIKTIPIYYTYNV